MTMAMFDWKGSALGLTGKMLAGALAFKDVDPKIIAERVCDQMPFLPEKLGSNAKALIKSRADAAWNGEIIPLIEPRYANTLDLIEELIINERKKLEVYDIYRAQADYLLMKGDMVTYPCCYTRWEPDNPNLGYIGDTSNKIRERDKGHGNAHHILTR